MKPSDLLSTHPLLSDRSRLAIMATLAASKEPVEFTKLLEILELTKGNLASHLKKLEDEGLIKVHKEFVDRKPRTTYVASDDGRKALTGYMKAMESLLSSLGPKGPAKGKKS